MQVGHSINSADKKAEWPQSGFSVKKPCTMQIKKSRELELERKKPTLFLLGLAVACAIVLSAFEWRTSSEDRYSGLPEVDEVPIFEATLIPRSFREKDTPVEKKKDVKKEVAKTIIDQFKFEEMDLNKNELDFPDLDNDPIPEDISQLTEEVFEEKILPIADIMPEFPGGDSARVAFLQHEVVYPRMAQDGGISGKVHVGFTVRKDGSITDIEVKKRAGGGLDEEAIRVVEAMPKWNPGIHRGRPVNVSFVMPISFKLKN
ncbi:MAG: protein TonB [Cryomorphaceae bacterium]